MLVEYSLDIPAMIQYAQIWAYQRNPFYYNFDQIGGDCTNFVSQCLYAGGAVMNDTPEIGWYYYSLQNRAPAWTGVRFFYDFIVNNQGIGPFGSQVPMGQVQVGDVIQLGDRDRFYHSLFVVDLREGMPYVSAHSKDVFSLPLYAYRYERSRCIHIRGARKDKNNLDKSVYK